MTRRRAKWSTALASFIGGGSLIYLVMNVSPYAAEGRLNPAALLAFMLALFLLAGGLGGLIALRLHERWPTLAGVKTRRLQQPLPVEPALRQGILVGLVAVVWAALAMARMLDIAVLLVTLLIAGLAEAYVQSRG
jgi:MFS family permease